MPGCQMHLYYPLLHHGGVIGPGEKMICCSAIFLFELVFMGLLLPMPVLFSVFLSVCLISSPKWAFKVALLSCERQLRSDIQ